MHISADEGFLYENRKREEETRLVFYGEVEKIVVVGQFWVKLSFCFAFALRFPLRSF